MLNNSSDKIKKEFENLRNELLDLTLRNQLLNFKSRARTITIANQSPINIYQTLVLQNNKMYFVANKKEEKKLVDFNDKSESLENTKEKENDLNKENIKNKKNKKDKIKVSSH